MAHADAYPFHPANPNQELKVIRGIGPAKQRWLNALGVDTVADLARCQPQTLIEQLTARNHRTSLEDVKAWINRAQALESATGSTQRPAANSTAPSIANAMPDMDGAQTGVRPKTLPLLKNDSPVENGRSLATFQVELVAHQADEEEILETRVYHGKSDDAETWEGLADEALQQWMIAHVNAPKDPTDIPPVPTDDKLLATVKLPQLSLHQDISSHPSMIVVEPRYPFLSSAIASGQPFNLQLAFQLTDLEHLEHPDLPTESIQYRIQVKASHLETQQTTMLTDQKASLVYDTPEATYLNSPALVLPAPGIYRLKVSVTVLNLPSTPGRFILPLVQAA